jgi:class 3 adenylate cyclase/tetratricopeptide (TPR) repeat protein
MSHCPSCGEEVGPDLRFCLACGTSLAAESCEACGTARVAGARFCGHCGSRLEEATAALQATSTQEPNRPTERRLVSVLFADLVGFTAISEQEDPEAVREFLSAFFERAGNVIDRYGGTVEKFIGDAVMAVWGTPTAHEDDAERATRAALELIDMMQELQTGTEIRAAITTGEAAVTLGATGQGMVAGDLVNTSSRLQSAAAPGSVLVDETTMVAAGRAIAFDSAGAIELKGKAEPVKAWTASHVVAERGGGGRRDVLEPPFVSRSEELRLLKDSLHATGREGKVRLVTMVGQAGLGKSRLAWELKKYSDGLMESIYWHEGRSPAYGEGVAYWALGEMVRQRCELRDGDDDDEARAKVTDTIAKYITDETERAWVEPRIAALLGLAEVPSGEGEELFAAWRTFFERIAEHGTVVLIFEDIHWADESLFDFIDHLLEWARSSAIMVVALARPDLLERRPTWGAGQRATITSHLEPLDDEAMGDLLRGLVPGLPAVQLQQVVQRAEGVPLYAVETVRMLLDEGRLVVEGERYRLVDTSVELAVPATLQALVTARLDSLTPPQRGLVQDASVVGKTFTRDAIGAVSGRDIAELEVLLASLARKEIVAIETSRTSPEQGQYGFVQGLLREVAYSTLARRDRRDRHLAAAKYFESLDDEELAGLVASHYLDAYRSAPDGPDGEEAARLASAALTMAAERSVSLHANAAALKFIEQALEVSTDVRQRTHLWVLASEPAAALGELDLGERYLRSAIDWYTSDGDRQAANKATAVLAASLVVLSRSEDVYQLIEPLLDAPDLDTDPSAPRLLNELARAYMWEDRRAEAAIPLDRGLAIAERLHLEPEIAELFATKSWAVDVGGRHREALLLAEGSLQLAQRNGVVSTELRARMNLSNGLVTTDPKRAFDISATGVAIAKRIGHATWAGALAGNQGTASFLIGEWDVPLGYLDESAEWTEMTKWGRAGLVGAATVVLAHREEPYQDLLREALGALDGVKSPQAQMWSVALEAFVAFAIGDLEPVAGLATTEWQNEMQGWADATIAMVTAVNAATWLANREQLERLDSGLGQLAWLGDVAILGHSQAKAAIAALDGETETALASYRDVLAGWRRLGMAPSVAMTEIGMLQELGDQLDDRTELAAEAREILTGLGAVTLLRQLDQAVSTTRDMEVAR